MRMRRPARRLLKIPLLRVWMKMMLTMQKLQMRKQLLREKRLHLKMKLMSQHCLILKFLMIQKKLSQLSNPLRIMTLDLNII